VDYRCVILKWQQSSCALQGTLPTEWADNGAFPLLRLLALDKNWRLGGSLPAAWGRNASSMAKLEVMELG
jgi:hypothetical protein